MVMLLTYALSVPLIGSSQHIVISAVWLPILRPQLTPLLAHLLAGAPDWLQHTHLGVLPRAAGKVYPYSDWQFKLLTCNVFCCLLFRDTIAECAQLFLANLTCARTELHLPLTADMQQGYL